MALTPYTHILSVHSTANAHPILLLLIVVRLKTFGLSCLISIFHLVYLGHFLLYASSGLPHCGTFLLRQLS
jgi:hypothetical protein